MVQWGTSNNGTGRGKLCKQVADVLRDQCEAMGSENQGRKQTSGIIWSEAQREWEGQADRRMEQMSERRWSLL